MDAQISSSIDSFADISEFDWEPLLQLIGERRVVSVVGPDLLTVDEERKVSLTTFLARSVAERLKVEVDTSSPVSFNQVATAYLERGGDIGKVYSALNVVMRAQSKLPIPEPLRKLVAIEPLNLFVSLSCDNLLERAIRLERPTAKPRIINYHPKANLEEADLLELLIGSDLSRLEEPVIFNLMGQASSLPHTYALTDEDTLEFVHSLGSPERRPARLLGTLAENPVLILGSGFSGWLARFFLRLTQKEFWWAAQGEGMRQDRVIADDAALADKPLMDFLQRFKGRAQVFEGGADDFVEQLSSQWAEKGSAFVIPVPPEPGPTDPIATGNEGTYIAPRERGTVFISYAREDHPIAKQLAQDLGRAGVPIWFDFEQIAGGEDWENEIKEGIETCILMVPIISIHTLTPERREFKAEWKLAEKEYERRFGEFIIPVAVDDTPVESEELPGSFKRAQWLRLRNGQVTPEIVGRIKYVFDDYERKLIEYKQRTAK